jgi:hypothetical protein
VDPAGCHASLVEAAPPGAADHAADARLVRQHRRSRSSLPTRASGPRAAASPQPIVAADARFGPSCGSAAAADHATDARLGAAAFAAVDPAGCHARRSRSRCRRAPRAAAFPALDLAADACFVQRSPHLISLPTRASGGSVRRS